MSPEMTAYVLWFFWVLSWLGAAFWSAPTKHRAKASVEIGHRLVLILGIFLLFGLYAPRVLALTQLWRLPADGKWALDAVILLGFGFSWWARVHLGKLWSPGISAKDNHTVVDTGPYGLVRHPIYSGVLLSAFATAAIWGNLAALVGAVMMAAAWYWKAWEEEKFLRQELGAATYDDYAARVSMLFPLPHF